MASQDTHDVSLEPPYLMAACWWGLVATQASETVRHPSGTPFTASCVDKLHPKDSRKTLWATEAFWYSAFIPRYPDFRGDPAFGYLEKYEIERCEGGYRLHEETCRGWISLERHTCFTLVVLEHACDKLWPTRTRLPLSPEIFRYHHVHPTERDVRRACWKARGAFCNMIGYMAACVTILNTHYPTGPPKWVQVVSLVQPSHPYWFHAFTTSPLVADFTGAVPRQGLIVDMTSNTTANSMLPMLHEARIPLWYWFPYDTDPTTYFATDLKRMIVARASSLSVKTHTWHVPVDFDGPVKGTDDRTIYLGYSDPQQHILSECEVSLYYTPPHPATPSLQRSECHSYTSTSTRHKRPRTPPSPRTPTRYYTPEFQSHLPVDFIHQESSNSSPKRPMLSERASSVSPKSQPEPPKKRRNVDGEFDKYVDEDDVDSGVVSKPFVSTGQKEGETLHNFMRRRAIEDYERAKLDTPSDLNKYAQRVSYSSGRNGQRLSSASHVYVWRPIPVHPYHLRLHITKGKALERFTEYAPTQRIYHPRTDSWDCCTDLNPHHNDTDEPDWSDEDEQERDQELTDVDDARHASTHSSHTEKEPPLPKTELEGTVFGFPDLDRIERILANRYAITPTEETWPLSTSDVEREKKVKDSLRPFAERDAMSTELLSQHALTYSLFQVIETIKSTGELPTKYSYATTNIQDLLNTVPDSLTTCTSQLTKDGKTLYVLQTVDQQDSPWSLAVHEIATVGQILRERWGPTSATIARELLRRGIPFTALWRDPARFVQVERNPGILPLYRATSYTWDVEDYRGYALCRSRYLQNEAIASCALRRGGILWRLAIESGVHVDEVAYDKSKRQVLDPFKIEVLGEILVTEGLPEGISDMIIGLCKTYTGTTICF